MRRVYIVLWLFSVLACQEERVVDRVVDHYVEVPAVPVCEPTVAGTYEAVFARTADEGMDCKLYHNFSQRIDPKLETGAEWEDGCTGFTNLATADECPRVLTYGCEDTGLSLAVDCSIHTAHATYASGTCSVSGTFENWITGDEESVNCSFLVNWVLDAEREF